MDSFLISKVITALDIHLFILFFLTKTLQYCELIHNLAYLKKNKKYYFFIITYDNI